MHILCHSIYKWTTLRSDKDTHHLQNQLATFSGAVILGVSERRVSSSDGQSRFWDSKLRFFSFDLD